MQIPPQLPHIEYTITLEGLIKLFVFLIALKPMVRFYESLLIFIAEHRYVVDYVREQQNITKHELAAAVAARIPMFNKKKVTR